MENVKEIIAKNLCELRKSRKYTQQDLAERLNYSDKAISRWEHAETLPDIETLCKICEIYGVKFEYLLQKEQPKKNNPYLAKKDMPNKVLILLIAVVSVWIATIVAYTYMDIILNTNAWQLFIWAIPVSCIVCIVCNSFLFKSRIFKYIYISVLVWSSLLSVYIQLLGYNIWLLFIIGIPIQALILLTGMYRPRR